MTFEQRLEWFSERNKIMLFLWNDRFLNPLIPTQLQKIKSSGLLDYDKLLQVLDEHFPQFEDELPPGMYFPVPISRTLTEGEEFSPELALRFFYGFIHVDGSQKWSLRGKLITGKVLSLFESNLFFEEETSRCFVEYWSENRWDKCYLECATTPFLALSIESTPDGFQLLLNNHKTDSLDLQSFRIDTLERCFVRTQNHGEVLLADAPRFWLLDHLNESGSHLVVDEHLFPLFFSK